MKRSYIEGKMSGSSRTWTPAILALRADQGVQILDKPRRCIVCAFPELKDGPPEIPQGGKAYPAVLVHPDVRGYGLGVKGFEFLLACEDCAKGMETV